MLYKSIILEGNDLPRNFSNFAPPPHPVATFSKGRGKAFFAHCSRHVELDMVLNIFCFVYGPCNICLGVLGPNTGCPPPPPGGYGPLPVR